MAESSTPCRVDFSATVQTVSSCKKGIGAPSSPIQSVDELDDVGLAFRDELFVARQFGKLMLRQHYQFDGPVKHNHRKSKAPMIHSSSRPADLSSSTSAKTSDSNVSSIDDVPFDVNVDMEATSFQTDDEQLIHNERSLKLAAPFVNKWNRLVSQTNWEKGRIIIEWRTQSIESGTSASDYSDDVWARSVAGVSPQHVGRLRRVFERFKDSYASYEGLFWTHFMAALDWNDAELWLEGAVQSRWSVSQMRRTRWESMGQDPNEQPNESEMVTAEADEDFSPLSETDDATETDRELQDRIGTTGPLAEGPDFGEGESSGETSAAGDETYEDIDSQSNESVEDRISPFASLPQLPVDVAEAMEQFKLAIVRHRATQWQDVSPATIHLVLDALGKFAQSGG